MLRIRTLLSTILLSAAALAAFAPAQALASHNQPNYFEASTELLNPATRPHAINQLRSLGVKALRVELAWYDVAPAQKSATKPAFDA